MGIRCNVIFAAIADCSIKDIKSWTVTKDENGIPTGVTGINPEWLLAPIVDAIGMSVLALQDALRDY